MPYIRHLVAMLLSSLICQAGTQPSLAYASVAQTVDAGTKDASYGQPREEAGVKSWIIREMTEFLASTIRKGGQMAAWIVERLDRSAARAFRKHAKNIADELDRIAQIPDLTTRIVKEKLYNFLRNDLGLSGGTSLQIADLVKAALDILVF